MFDPDENDSGRKPKGMVKQYRNKHTGDVGYQAVSKSGNIKLFKNKDLAHKHADSED